ncbi:MAG: DOMON-like domain-containing protein [Pseudomonadota bacterium]
MLRQAQHERDGAVHTLVCHPDTPAKAVTAVTAQWSASDVNETLLTFTVSGTGAIVIPERSSPVRTDGLWRTTCFEMFWHPDDATGYVEVNLSPSGKWAAYAFDGYRAGMREQPMEVDPHVEVVEQADRLILDADIDFSTFPGRSVRIALSAVIEETDGTRSYWALRHPPGPPDFHHPDCFALELPALGSA